MSKRNRRSHRDMVIISLLGIAVIVAVSLLDRDLFTGSAVFESCFESDPLRDFYVKGYAEYGSRKWEDVCSSDGRRLQQAYCKTSVKVSMTHTYQCPYGCLDGACVAPEINCGNGIVDYGEQCDDGNQDDGDGCRKNCIEELGFTCRTTSVCSQEP